MAMQTSSYRVWSQRTPSSIKKTSVGGLFNLGSHSSSNIFPFLTLNRYSSNSSEEFDSVSKRRSRGPVMAAKKAAQGLKQEDGKYKHTIDLPKTTFGMRANSVVREPEIQKLWDDNQVFKKVAERNNGESFILHDGPPYANGDLHVGHALNKILKDIINRYKVFTYFLSGCSSCMSMCMDFDLYCWFLRLLQNHKVQYVPGWDCHGLPIEKDLTPIKLRAKAAKFAKATVNTQMKSFRVVYFYTLWVWADWEHPYLTLHPEYEAAQVEVFGQMYMKKHIYRGRKLVHWSPSSRTALAEAELEYTHPIDNRECPVVIAGDYITTESGTGLVHTAPGHGQEDYVTGLKYSLPVIAPVDDEGKFTEEAGRFSGLCVLGDGNVAVVKYLDEQLSLVMEEPYKHKYPYDWRTKKTTIFRATEQWFASVEGFRQAAMDEISKVKWIPEKAENRISTMTSNRSDWCISRQRTWGVPIPVFYHVVSKEPLMNKETIDHIKSIISQKGSDAWWYMTVEELLPEKYRNKASEYQKGTDTMDVWFDSGSSWAASSLLTSIATKGKAPYMCVITHGFVLDEKGLKMSKSLGNVVDPNIVIEGGKNTKDQPSHGADVLRLWVSSVDYTTDVLIGPQILCQMSDIYRKLRGTLRYLLANLHDWKNATPYNDLPKIDQYALEDTVRNQTIQNFAIIDLSSFYFDVAKDRLYVGAKENFTRRCCQTVLAAHLISISRVITPILPHLAEDAWQNLPFEHSNEDGSVSKFVFESKWPKLIERWLAMPAEDVEFWSKMLKLRTEVNKVLETARTGKLIGSSLDAKIYLYVADDDFNSRLHRMSEALNEADPLHRIFITSQVEIVTSLENERQTDEIPCTGEYLIEGGGKVWIGATRAEGSKCERCWNYSPKVGSYVEHPTLCPRCYEVVGAQPLPAVAAAVS
ncbi:hypothetical protein MKX01_042726 [Papaver californicum]|nr:hypothetical protein MKX01_042726 [Papaver californicum]